MVNKITLTIIAILALVITIQGAMAEDMGIYTIDTEDTLESDGTTEIDIGKSAITHLRDNYYGLVYEDTTNTDIRLRIIEMGDNPIVTNSTELYFEDDYVDDKVISSSLAKSSSKVDIISFDKEIGLGILSYVTPAQYLNIKSFLLYQNGTISMSDTLTTSVHNDYTDVDIAKTGNYTFLYVGTKDYTNMDGGGYAASGATLTTSGSITTSGTNVNYLTSGTATGSPEVNLVKAGTNCQVLFKSNTETLVRHSHTCTNTSFSGGTSSADGGTATTNIQVEGNVVDNVDAYYNEYNDVIYLTYTETIDNYGIINVLDTSMTSLNKERYLGNVALQDHEMILGEEGNAIIAYTKDEEIENEFLQLITLVIEANGNYEVGYTADEYSYGYNSNLYKVYNTTNNYILTNQYFDGFNDYGTLTTLGIGVLPPPTAADTSVSIIDERTLEAFNMDNKTLTFYAHCEDNINYQENITSTTQSIPVTCNYESFSIQVQSEITPEFVYTRKYLRDLEAGQEQFDLDVYLINPHTTTYIDNEVQIDDMTGTYTDPKLYFNKNINGETTQITASGLDLTNSMRAVLMHDQEYYVYLESDETGLNYLGKYQSPSTSEGNYKESVIHLFDIDLTPNINIIQELIQYQFEVDEDDLTVTYFAQTPDGGDPSIINLDVQIYNGSVDTGTLIYDEFHGLENYSHSTLYSFLSGTVDLSAYENDTINAEMTIGFIDNGEIRYLPYETTIWINEKLTLPIEEHLGEGVLDWFLVILLGTVALFATVKSANLAAIGIIGLASLFVLFGWFSLGAGALGLAALVSFVNLISSNKREVELQ